MNLVSYENTHRLSVGENFLFHITLAVLGLDKDSGVCQDSTTRRIVARRHHPHVCRLCGSSVGRVADIQLDRSFETLSPCSRTVILIAPCVVRILEFDQRYNMIHGAYARFEKKQPMLGWRLRVHKGHSCLVHTRTSEFFDRFGTECRSRPLELLRSTEE